MQCVELRDVGLQLKSSPSTEESKLFEGDLSNHSLGDVWGGIWSVVGWGKGEWDCLAGGLGRMMMMMSRIYFFVVLMESIIKNSRESKSVLGLHCTPSTVCTQYRLNSKSQDVGL